MKNFIGLPDVLKPYATQARWVVWKFVTRKGKPTKPPFRRVIQANTPIQRSRHMGRF